MEGAQRDLAAVDDRTRLEVLDLLLRLPKIVGDPHAHGGAGIRKIHRKGFWEARAGLKRRIVFRLEPHLLVLYRIGDHDEIERYLRTL